MRELVEQTDKDAIHDLLATYALALDVDDVDSCLALFTDDAEFLVYGKTLNGERIRKMFTRAPRGMHLVGAAMVEVRGDTAAARSQVLFVDSTNHEMRPALYDDELTRTARGWRFKSRRCQFLTASGLQDAPQEGP